MKKSTSCSRTKSRSRFCRKTRRCWKTQSNELRGVRSLWPVVEPKTQLTWTRWYQIWPHKTRSWAPSSRIGTLLLLHCWGHQLHSKRRSHHSKDNYRQNLTTAWTTEMRNPFRHMPNLAMKISWLIRSTTSRRNWESPRLTQSVGNVLWRMMARLVVNTVCRSRYCRKPTRTTQRRSKSGTKPFRT